MEHNDEIKKRKIKDIAFRIVVMIFLIFIIVNLYKIREMIKEHYEAFEENPLLFGAKKYNLNQCTCQSGDSEFKFNQEKMWIEKQTNSSYNLNTTILWDSLI